jgi:hypothetical protein
VFPVFQNSKPKSPYIKVVPNFLEHALEKFELKQKPFGTILAPFVPGTRLSDTGTLVTLQLSVPSLKPHDIHTQTTKHSQGNKSFTAILPQIHEDLHPIGVRTRAEATVPRVRPWLTRPVHYSSHTRVLQCTPARARRSTTARAPRHAYKAALGLDRTSPRALSPARAKVHWTSPRARRATARQATRASATAASSLQSLPSRASHLVSFANSP